MKGIIIALLLSLSSIAFSQPDTLQTIRKGTYAPGTLMRDSDDKAWDKSNEMFRNIYLRLSEVSADFETSAELANQLSDETGTGAAVFATSPTFSTSIIMGDANLNEAELEIIDGGTVSTDELNVLDGIPGTLTAAELGYSDGVTSNIQTQLDTKLSNSDTTGAETVLQLMSDTMLVFHAVYGVGNAGDTVGFNLDSVIWAADWDNSYVLTLTKVSAKVKGSSPDIDLAFLSNTTPVAAGATAVLSADMTVTSTATWTDATSFNDAEIAKGESLLVRIDQLTSKPVQLIFNVFGYYSK